MAQGRTPGEQNINRAELVAILSICQSISAAVIYTDSAYALNLAQGLQHGKQIGAHADHIDLLSSLQEVVTPAHVIHKIKSHVDINQIDDPLSCYRALGNRIADEAAASACSTLHQDMAANLFRIHSELHASREQLRQICKLHLELHQARQAADNQREQTDDLVIRAHSTKSPLQIQQTLMDWRPANPVAYGTVYMPPSVVEHFIFGPFWAEEISKWIRTLQWDVDGFGPTERDIGVTWCELGLSFAIFAQMLLPIQRKNEDGTVMIIFRNSAEEAENLTYSFSDLAISMFQFWTAFHSLSFGCSPIVLTKGPQYSLTLLGFRISKSGVGCATSSLVSKPFSSHSICGEELVWSDILSGAWSLSGLNDHM